MKRPGTARLKQLKFDSAQRYRIYLMLFIAVIVTVFGCFWGAEKQAELYDPRRTGASVKSYITITTATHPRTIAKQFLGFSMETADVCAFLTAQRNHPEINAYLANFQPFVLRIGGNSADKTLWNPSHGCGLLPPSNLGKPVIDSLFAYARQHRLSVIWTLNMKNNQPQEAAAEAAYVYQSGRGNVAGIAIGNEPNDYKNSTYAELANRWLTYYTLIHKTAPNLPIIGPDAAGLIGCAECTHAYMQPFLQHYASNLDIATMHYYALLPNKATIASLLAASTMGNFEKTAQLATVVKGLSSPLIIDETNSVSSGGRPGVSDTFAAALWALDYLYSAAENGIQGVYFHGSMGLNDTVYTPVGKNLTGVYAKPVYYAMLAFHNAAPGHALAQASIRSPLNLRCHVVIDSDGKLHMTVINKDLLTATAASITLPRSYRTATLTRLEAPSITARSVSITLGGSAVSRQGQWRDSISEQIPVTSDKMTIIVPPASAALVTAQD